MGGRIIRPQESNKLPYPRIGQVKCGMRAVSPKTGKEYPTSVDYFIPSGKYASLFTDAYGEKPSTIQIVFPSNDADKVCSEEWQYRDDQGALVASGDGITFKVWSAKQNKYIELSAEQYPNLMQDIAQKFPTQSGWQVTLTLNFVCPLIRGVVGVWQLVTKGSASSIPNIRDCFDKMLEQNGKVEGIIWDLNVTLAKSNKPQSRSKYPVLSLVPNESKTNVELVKTAYANKQIE